VCYAEAQVEGRRAEIDLAGTGAAHFPAKTLERAGWTGARVDFFSGFHHRLSSS
jgi:hypothetical protein